MQRQGMDMARSKIPKRAEFWMLKNERGEVADFQVTSVSTSSDYSGAGSTITIKGVMMRQRMEMAESPSYVTHTGNITVGSPYSVPGYTTLVSQPTVTFDAYDDKKIKKGMAVQIKTIETVDGTKAQIVLSVGTKNVIAWESEAFEDTGEGDSLVTASSQAQKAAESHAKDVLKKVFNQ